MIPLINHDSSKVAVRSLYFNHGSQGFGSMPLAVGATGSRGWCLIMCWICHEWNQRPSFSGCKLILFMGPNKKPGIFKKPIFSVPRKKEVLDSEGIYIYNIYILFLFMGFWWVLLTRLEGTTGTSSFSMCPATSLTMLTFMVAPSSFSKRMVSLATPREAKVWLKRAATRNAVWMHDLSKFIWYDFCKRNWGVS